MEPTTTMLISESLREKGYGEIKESGVRSQESGERRKKKEE
jgi:hypothetical protein